MVRKRIALFASMMCGVLASCEVGPDFHLPDVALFNAPDAQGKFLDAHDPLYSDTSLPPRWWRLYNSPVLDRLIADAFAANTDLRVAAANLDRAHALLKQARVARQPTFVFNYNPQYSRISAEEFFQPKLVPPAVFYDLGISASYEVDLFGRLQRGIEAAEADDEAARAARDLARVTVVAAVTSAYTDLCGATEDLGAANHLLALQRRRYDYVRKLFVDGRGTVTDATQNQGAVAQVASEIPGLIARQRNAQLRLAALTGRPPKGLPPVACAEAPILDAPVPVGDGTRLLRRRPDVREAERALAAATARVGVATADLYPRITFNARVGSNGIMQDFLEPITNLFAIGPGITWELNQSVARARIKETEAVTREALASFDGVVLNALKETETALSDYKHALEQMARLQVARDRAARVYGDLAQLESAGRVDSLSSLDADRSLATAELALAESRSQAASAQVALFLALGGGWEDQAVEAGTTPPSLPRGQGNP